MNLTKWILVSANLPILAAALYALWVYKRSVPVLKVFSWFIFLSAVIQLVSLVLWFYRINNMPLLHIYVCLGFLCLALFYKRVLESLVSPGIITTIAILFTCFTITNSVAIQNIHTFNSHALTAESVLVVILSLSTFIVLLNDAAKETRKDSISSLRWINSGLFIYFAADLLLFYFGKIILSEFPKSLSRYTWVLHSFFSTVMYICFIIGLWKQPKNSIS